MITGEKNLSWRMIWVSWLVISGAIAASGESVLAQITPDTTLGSENSTFTSIGAVDSINGGATRGANLFHSFGEFNIDEGRAAVFTNPVGIENILTRVTGANPSNIFGTLGVRGGNANLFLINPNGIIFGPNARLDVGGSFVGTTANAIGLTNGETFSANSGEPLPNQLLDVNPNAFFFNQVATQPIQVSSGGFRGIDRNTYKRLYDEGLRVPDNRSLVLLGGDVIFNSGSLTASGGRIELAGVAESGTVGLAVNGENLSLSVPNSVSRADVSLNQFLADVVAGGGGSITVNARNLNILDNSELQAGIGAGLGSVNARARDITLNATEAMTIADSYINNGLGDLQLANQKLPALKAVGQGGDINIQAASLYLRDSAELITGTAGQGDAGNISIRANESVSLILSAIGSTSWDNAVGKGGDIKIQAGSLSLTYGAMLGTVSLGEGNSGSILIQVDDSVLVKGSNIDTQVLSTAIGEGGDINIQAGESITFSGGSSLTASTYGRGDAGDVLIQTDDSVSIAGSAIQTRVESDAPGVLGSRAEGNGGDITIEAKSLTITDLSPSGGFTAVLSTSTKADGNAGSVLLRVNDSITLTGTSVISAAVESEAVGQGGDIDIQTGSFSLRDGAFVNTSTRGKGQGGDIRVTASDSVNLSGVDSYGYTSELAVSTWREASGRAGDLIVNSPVLRLFDGATINARTLNSSNGGNITINANTLEAANGGQVVTTSLGNGTAGNINLNVTDNITLAGSDATYFRRFAQLGEEEVAGVDPASGVFANTTENSTGQGGNLNITTGQLVVQNDAQVNVSSDGSGNAGNLGVTSGNILLDNQGFLRATTSAGEGGNIDLRSPDLILMRRGSNITTNATGTATGGNITIDTGVIIALEDSDITANAEAAFGGQVSIDAQAIFGTQFREAKTSDSDITATSELGSDFSGTVDINTPVIEPSSGLVSLPTVPIDTEVAQACTPGGGQAQSKFVITGRGGLPPNPNEALSSDAVQIDWVTLNPEIEDKSSPDVSTNPTAPELAPIVEAQGWVIGDNGEVVLTASVPTATPHSSWQTPANCGAS